MSIQRIKSVRIAGCAAAVPAQTIETVGHPYFKTDDECQAFINNVGVERRRLHDGSITCADLCMKAAQQLISDLGWEYDEIDMLVFLSQSQDYILPATSCILHGKLGLKQSCTCFDISLGCSGWTYGLSIVGGMMESGAFRKVLLLMGDAWPTGTDPIPKYPAAPLFGDAGTATALEFNSNASEIVVDTRTDGTGYEAIIQRGGGRREGTTENSLTYKEDKYGNIHTALDVEMDGAAVFIFGISQVPRAIKDMLKEVEKTVDDVDCFLFHQANLMMNEQIRKKCKLPEEKVPYSIKDFGNNSSASIPLTMVTAARDTLNNAEKTIVACAFGVGLSWATMYTKLQNPIISPLIEV